MILRHLAEADDAEVVTRELRGDERVQRHRHLLGGEEVVAHRHGQRQVDHQHGARADEVLGPLDLEVLGCEPDRVPPPARWSRVADRALDVEVERIAELVGLGLVGPLVAGAGALDLVLAHLVAGQLLEQLVQRVATDLADAGRRQLEASLLLLDQSRLLEHLGQLGQPIEAAGRVVTQQLPCAVDVDLGQRAGVVRAAEEVLELVDVAELVHERGRLGEPERILAAEVVAPVPTHVRERGSAGSRRADPSASGGPCPP